MQDNSQKTTLELNNEISVLKQKIESLEKTVSSAQKNETKFRELKTKYLQLTNHAKVGIYEYDIEKAGFIEVNDYMCEFIGASREELLSVNPFVFLSENSRKHMGERREKLLRGEKVPEIVELEFENKVEQRRWVLLAQSFIPPEGKPRKALGIAHEITERKLFEQETLRVKDEWEKTFDTVPDLVFILNTDFEMVRVNQTTADCIGLDKEDCIGKKCYQLVHGSDGPLLNCPCDKLYRTGETQTLDFFIDSLNKDYHISASPLRDATGKLTGCVHVAHDISNLKKIQNELMEARVAAEAANTAKSDFLANISHEIRTPLTAVLGYADLLSEPTLDKDALASHIKSIHKNGHLLMNLISDILDLSKIEAGKMDIQKGYYSIESILEGITSLMSLRAKEKDLELKVFYEFPLPREILTDATRLRQILLNIVGNAIKFTEKGFVHIKVRCTDEHRKRNELEFEVTDTGIGITTEEMKKLFHPFTQADTSSARQFGGTGLGLTISRRLTEMLDGKIRVTSTPRKGSSFFLTVKVGLLKNVPMINSLPANTNEEFEKNILEEDKKFEGRVLLAEDSIDTQNLIKLFLEKIGLEVEVAENGYIACRKALASKAEGEPFRLILMDIQMPEMDGYEATIRLRREGWGNPIIALTAHALAGSKELCLKVGCNDYLPKPISRKQLIAMIRKHLERKKAAD